MNYLYKILISLIAILFATHYYGQDWHFSQFNDAPILINPANSGSYAGDYRANLNYKNQWASISNPYTSMAASFDMPVLRNYNGHKMTGAGISILRDKAGKSEYGFTQINLAISQSIAVSKFQEISLGLSFGYGQLTSNINGLRWDSQFNGAFHDPSLPTREGIYFADSKYFDISSGILARFFDSDLNETQIGASMAHLNRPWQATLSDINDDVLRMRLIVHAKSQIPFNSSNDIFLIPSAYFSMQSASTEILAGLNVKSNLGFNSKYTGYNSASFIYIGGYYRYNDALIASFQYEWRSTLKVGISYDINLSLLTPATSSRGGMEISVAWLGKFGYNARSVRTIRRRTF